MNSIDDGMMVTMKLGNALSQAEKEHPQEFERLALHCLHVMKKTHDLLQRDGPRMPALRRVIDALIVDDDLPREAVCRKCHDAYCCYQHVWVVSPEEARDLVEEAQWRKHPIDRERLAKQAEITRNLPHENQDEAFLKAPLEDRRCVFLQVDNRCAVYRRRPLLCRLHFVVDPAAPACCKTDEPRMVMMKSCISGEAVLSAVYQSGKMSGGALAEMIEAVLNEEGQRENG